MTQKYQVKVSMKQAAIVETGIVLKQGDFGMQIEIEVLDFDATGTTPQIVFRKAMGAVESTTITVSGNKYTYTFVGTELDTPGKCFCDLKLKNSTTQRISTASFIFRVVADTLDGLNEHANSYSDTIGQIWETLQDYSEDSEAWAKGTKGGVPVSSTDEQYKNNAKWYSDLISGTSGKVLSAKEIDPSYTDLNQFTVMGVYPLTTSTNYSHDPIGPGIRRVLLTLSNNQEYTIGQVILETDNGAIYSRSCANGTWSAWGSGLQKLTEQVNKIKDAIINKDINFLGVSSLIWERGGLDSSTGAETNSASALAYNVRSQFNAVISGERYTFRNPTGKNLKVYTYKADKSFYSADILAANTRVINYKTFSSQTAYFRIQMTDANGIAPEDAAPVFYTTDAGYENQTIEDVWTNTGESSNNITGTYPLRWRNGLLDSSTGAESYSTIAFITQFVPVIQGEEYIFHNDVRETLKVYTYKSDKSFYSADVVAGNTNRKTAKTFSDQTAFFRIQVSNLNGITYDRVKSIYFETKKGYLTQKVDNNKRASDNAFINFDGCIPLTWETGGLDSSTGAETDSASAQLICQRSPFIKVVSGKTYTFINNSSKTLKVYTYASDKTFISGDVMPGNTDAKRIKIFGNTTAYFRIQMSDTNGITIDDIDSVMVAYNGGYIYDYLKEATSKASVSILFVGNSLTQDSISYLPYLLKTYYPEISFKFYIWYNGGYTLAQQYEKFEADTACEIFSVAENTSAWTNSNNTVKMSSILSTYQFDIVCMQEYFNYKETYTEEDLTDWNNCRDYIQENYTGGNGLEFISLFHAPMRTDIGNIYRLTKAGNQLILKETISQDMIPVGIAIYKAWSTPLRYLGDGGDLTPGDRTHTQEGVPCLIQTYCALAWLLDKVAINKSVYGCAFRMTTEIYETLNVPGPNLGTGVITGTDEENRLAQEVAIMAYKEGKYIVSEAINPD